MGTTVAGVYDILFGMRRCRINFPNRCYHLISRVPHRAYFLDEDERTRLVDFVRRVADDRFERVMKKLNELAKHPDSPLEMLSGK
jgi:hypothetical protein